MTPTEKIENDYPQYKFKYIHFPDNLFFFHGFIRGRVIYINKNDPIELQAKTALHEITHAEIDKGCNLLDHRPIKTIRAEGFANRIADRDIKKYISK